MKITKDMLVFDNIDIGEGTSDYISFHLKNNALAGVVDQVDTGVSVINDALKWHGLSKCVVNFVYDRTKEVVKEVYLFMTLKAGNENVGINVRDYKADYSGDVEDLIDRLDKSAFEAYNESYGKMDWNSVVEHMKWASNKCFMDIK